MGEEVRRVLTKLHNLELRIQFLEERMASIERLLSELSCFISS